MFGSLITKLVKIDAHIINKCSQTTMGFGRGEKKQKITITGKSIPELKLRVIIFNLAILKLWLITVGTYLKVNEDKNAGNKKVIKVNGNPIMTLPTPPSQYSLWVHDSSAVRHT